MRPYETLAQMITCTPLANSQPLYKNNNKHTKHGEESHALLTHYTHYTRTTKTTYGSREVVIISVEEIWICHSIPGE
jgi:hypothetical protein